MLNRYNTTLSLIHKMFTIIILLKWRLSLKIKQNSLIIYHVFDIPYNILKGIIILGVKYYNLILLKVDIDNTLMGAQNKNIDNTNLTFFNWFFSNFFSIYYIICLVWFIVSYVYPSKIRIVVIG